MIEWEVKKERLCLSFFCLESLLLCRDKLPIFAAARISARTTNRAKIAFAAMNLKNSRLRRNDDFYLLISRFFRPKYDESSAAAQCTNGFYDRMQPPDVYARAAAGSRVFFWAAYFCSRSSSLRIRAFSFFMVRFQSRYCEIQTTAKLAAKIPA